MKLEDALKSVGVNTGVITNIFHHMEIAEEVLSAYKAENPDRASEIDCLFPCCRWPTLLRREAPEKLYRTHLGQLADKLLAGVNLDTPTGIEIACMLVGVGEKVPIKYSYMQYLAASSPSTMVAFDIADYEAVAPGNPTIQDTIQGAFEKVGTRRDQEYKIAVKKRTPKAQPELL